MGYELMPAVFTSFLLSNADSISDDVESDFGIGKQPEPFAYVLWNRDLSLRCYTHNCFLLLLILLLPTCRDQDTTSLLKRPPTILRLDVAVDAVARRGDSFPALFTVVLAKDDRH